MAEIKKYLDNVALAALVENIKAEDAKVLTSAQGYADGLAKNYDASGSAAQALVDAKAYADGLASNYDEAGAAATAKTEAVEAAKSYTDTEVANVKAIADTAQEEVDNLEIYVGTIPTTSTAQSVIAYVNEKTSGIATEGAMTKLGNRVTAVEGEIDAIQADYLKAADKTELSDAITAEANRAKGIEGGLETRLKAVEDDYLKAADKTELQGNIDTVAGKVTTLVGEDAGKSARTIANEELAKQLIAEGAQESLDTLGEIAAWIQSHPGDAAAMNKAIEDLEAFVGVLPEDVTATTIVGYIQEAVAAEQARAEGAESDLSDRLDDVEAALGTGEGSVADQIAAAKQAAIDAAAADATTKAGNAETAAKDHADGLNTTMDARVVALEAVDHEHTNKALLDTYTQTEVNLADAVAKKHEHTNKAVLDGITAELVTAWKAAEQNAKDYAYGLNTAMTTKVDGIGTRVGALETASATHALKTDLNDAVARIAANEANITANTSAINSFTAITSKEVDALFA